MKIVLNFLVSSFDEPVAVGRRVLFRLDCLIIKTRQSILGSDDLMNYALSAKREVRAKKDTSFDL